MTQDEVIHKKKVLINRLKELENLLVAYSGGVDSTFLLSIAHQILGDRVVAATADSVTFPEREKEEAVRFTHEEGILHILFKTDEMKSSNFIENTRGRCYYCKKHICKELIKIASKREFLDRRCRVKPFLLDNCMR